MPEHCEHVPSEEEQKKQEVFVVLVPEAVVNERAVVVKTLDALVAVVAMHCVLWPQILTVDADVVQVKLFVDKALHQAQKVFL